MNNENVSFLGNLEILSNSFKSVIKSCNFDALSMIDTSL